MKTHLIHTLLFLVTVSLSAANSQARKFTVYAPTPLKTSSQLYFSNGQEYIPLTFTKGSRSETYLRAVSNSFEVFTTKVVDDQTIFVPVGKTKIDPTIKRLLYLIEQTSDGGKLQITALNDTVENFPRGTYKYYNLTQFPITASLNGSQCSIPPQKITQVKPEIPNGGALIPFYLYYKDVILHECRLYCQASERRIIFITRNRKGDSRRPIKLSYLPQLIGADYR